MNRHEKYSKSTLQVNIGIFIFSRKMYAGTMVQYDGQGSSPVRIPLQAVQFQSWPFNWFFMLFNKLRSDKSMVEISLDPPVTGEDPLPNMIGFLLFNFFVFLKDVRL